LGFDGLGDGQAVTAEGVTAAANVFEGEADSDGESIVLPVFGRDFGQGEDLGVPHLGGFGGRATGDNDGELRRSVGSREEDAGKPGLEQRIAFLKGVEYEDDASQVAQVGYEGSGQLGAALLAGLFVGTAEGDGDLVLTEEEVVGDVDSGGLDDVLYGAGEGGEARPIEDIADVEEDIGEGESTGFKVYDDDGKVGGGADSEFAQEFALAHAAGGLDEGDAGRHLAKSQVGDEGEFIFSVNARSRSAVDGHFFLQ